LHGKSTSGTQSAVESGVIVLVEWIQIPDKELNLFQGDIL
jgi:hypothetical protein